MTTSFIEILESRIAPASAKPVSLASLNGSNGFVVEDSAKAFDSFGRHVSDAGDVNGDGFSDFIISASGQTEGDVKGAGAAYVIFGAPGGFPAKLNVTDINGTNGFKIAGSTEYAYAGNSVSSAGDINGDGFDDIVVAEPFASNGGDQTGSAYVIFGKANGFAATVQLSTLSGTAGFRVDGGHIGDTLGRGGAAVGSAGDFNGDGIDDLVLGAYNADPNGATSGQVYVIFGNKTTPFPDTLNVTALNGTNGVTLNGDVLHAYAGEGVTNGDINGDGISDLVIESGNLAQGRLFVVYGHTGTFSSTIELSSVNGTTGFRILGESLEDLFGISIATGDVNGDGFDDVIAGASGYPYGGDHAYQGRAYVIFGAATHANINVSSLNGTNGFRMLGDVSFDNVGRSVSSGDVNGDGIADVIVGAPGAKGAKAGSGAAYVIYGSDQPFSTEIALSTIDAAQGFRINGVQGGDYTGESVFAGGDLNGDGFDDMIVSATQTLHQTKVYVLFGGPGAISPHAFSFPDIDGELVTVKSTKGKLSRGDFDLVPKGLGYELQAIDFHGDAQFDGTNLTVTVKTSKGDAGDHLVDVETLDATGVALGKVKIAGNLGKIFADSTGPDKHGHLVSAVKSLSVTSLGEITAHAGVAEDYHSILNGPVGALVVKNTVRNVWLDVEGAGANIGKITIGGDLDGSSSGPHSGLITTADGNIGSVTVKGGIIGGADFSGIMADGNLGKITITGDLTSADPTKPVFISALGEVGVTKQKNATAILGLSISGDVLNAEILAGYNTNLIPTNADATIGAVSVKGDWSASSLAAGVNDTTNDGFGRNDQLIAGGDAAIIAKVASITIKGTATGSAAAGDFFGITAERIGKLTIGKTKEPFDATAADDISLDSTNNDFHAVDFA